MCHLAALWRRDGGIGRRELESSEQRHAHGGKLGVHFLIMPRICTKLFAFAHPPEGTYREIPHYFSHWPQRSSPACAQFARDGQPIAAIASRGRRQGPPKSLAWPQTSCSRPHTTGTRCRMQPCSLGWNRSCEAAGPYRTPPLPSLTAPR